MSTPISPHHHLRSRQHRSISACVAVVTVLICSGLQSATTAAIPAIAAPLQPNAVMRTMEGRYVRIVTDLPDTAASRDWTKAVDAAVPAICEFWQVPLDRVEGWRTTACMMSRKEPFIASGLLPSHVPDFPHGFQIGNDIWVLEQPSEYYTRHLLIHEAAHAFAFHVFGGAGPAWYMEGTAEYLATHRWDGQAIELGVIPDSSSAFPYWGRFKMLELRRAKLQSLSLISVLRYSDTAHRQVEPYAWTWAAVQLFAGHRSTRQILIDAARNGQDASPEFTRKFVAALGEQWPRAQVRWQLLIDDFDYGYDLPRNLLPFDTDPVVWDGSPVTLEINANHGWQSAGVIVRQGSPVRVSASGQFVLAEQPKPWVSDANGITLKYHRGRPLGTLVACIVPLQNQPEKLVQPLEIIQVGTQTSWTANQTGLLLFKISDVPAEREDNQGGLLVQLHPLE